MTLRARIHNTRKRLPHFQLYRNKYHKVRGSCIKASASIEADQADLTALGPALSSIINLALLSFTVVDIPNKS